MLVCPNTPLWRILLNATARRTTYHDISHWTTHKVCQNGKGATGNQKNPRQTDYLLHQQRLFHHPSPFLLSVDQHLVQEKPILHKAGFSTDADILRLDAFTLKIETVS